MPYIGKKPADIIATAVDTTTGTFSGDIDVKGAAVFNEDSADVDFRVESDTKTHALFVQGSDGAVGINKSSPTSGYMLHVGGSSGVHTKVKIEATTATGQAELDLSADPAGVSYLNLGDEDSNNIGYLGYFHSDNSMRFQTNSAEQVRIHSNGVLSASDGIALGVGTANTASNVLDDYEEGTWTPSPSSGSLTAYGTTWYVKVGNLVTCSFYLYDFSGGTGTDQVVINGLPFAFKGGTEAFFNVGPSGGTNSLPSSTIAITARIGQAGNTSLYFGLGKQGAAAAAMLYNQLGSGHYPATFSYQTA